MWFDSQVLWNNKEHISGFVMHLCKRPEKHYKQIIKNTFISWKDSAVSMNVFGCLHWCFKEKCKLLNGNKGKMQQTVCNCTDVHRELVILVCNSKRNAIKLCKCLVIFRSSHLFLHQTLEHKLTMQHFLFWFVYKCFFYMSTFNVQFLSNYTCGCVCIVYFACTLYTLHKIYLYLHKMCVIYFGLLLLLLL